MNKRKGISLIVLVITILVMIILAGVVVVSLSKNNPIEKAKEAEFKTNVIAYLDDLNMTLLGEEYVSLKKVINKTGDLKEYIKSFKKEDEGKFAIQNNKLVYVGDDEKLRKYAEELSIIEEGYPIPKLSETFTPIKWDNDNNEIKTTYKDKSWYDYNNKIYANAKTKNGSYYVWIPRFAYRIIYYDTEANLNEAKSKPVGSIEREEKAIGFSDVRGIVNKQGKEDYTFNRSYFLIEVEFLGNKQVPFSYLENDKFKYNVTRTKGEENPRGLVVHPAFSKFRRNNAVYTEGNYGENKEIDGFWISKFEMSEGKKSIPNVSSQRMLSTDEIFNIARNLIEDNNLESMNITNTKLGAVIYLTYFNQNTGKFAVSKNVHEGYRTGGLNYKLNIGQSITNNITGVYDLCGCSYETSSSYLANNSEMLNVYSKKLLENKDKRYVDVYKNGVESNSNSTYNENKLRYGDAIYELGNLGEIPSGDKPIYYIGNSYFDDSLKFTRITKGTGEKYESSSWRAIVVEK